MKWPTSLDAQTTIELKPLEDEAAPAPAPKRFKRDKKGQPRQVFVAPDGTLGVPRWDKPRPALLLFVSYAMAGLAPALLQQGRHRFVWTLAWLVAVGGWAAAIWYWPQVSARVESGVVPLLPAFAGAAFLTVLGFTAWARALRQTARDVRFTPDQLAGPIRHPVVVGTLGLLCPGLGLLVSSRGRRAAFVLWCGGPLVLAALVVWRAAWLWTCNAASGTRALPPLVLEWAFVAAGALVVLGVLGWVAAALDGARLVATRDGRASARADWLGLGLLAAVAALVVSLGPTKLAHDLDRRSTNLRQNGYCLIPLGLETGAMYLDPSQPSYVMRTAELYDLLGQPRKAQTLRAVLRQRWEAYAQMLLQHDIEVEKELLPEPIEVKPAKPLKNPLKKGAN